MLKNTHDDGGVGGTGLAGWTAWKMNNGGEVGMESRMPTTGGCTLLDRTISTDEGSKSVCQYSIYFNSFNSIQYIITLNELLIRCSSFIV